MWAPGNAPPGIWKLRLAFWPSLTAVPREADPSQVKNTVPAGKSLAVALSVAPGRPFDGETTSLGAASANGAVASDTKTASATSGLVTRRRRSRADIPLIGLASPSEPRQAVRLRR